MAGSASRIVPQILAVVLVIAIAWQLVQMTWLLLEREPETGANRAAAASVANAPLKTVNVQGIIDARLFGQPALKSLIRRCRKLR